ncbi:MAG: AMP-binding protein [Rivularia sp. ALOHA_DT_140]|nr:AMP-binding protein [Rivularia sp. ALOHA_DT_140]
MPNGFYKELNEKANQLARYLQSVGVKAETRVGICLERSEKMLVGLLGILKAGGTYIPLDPGFPEERLRFMVEDSGVDFLVMDSGETFYKTSLHDNSIILINLDNDWELITQQYKENLPSQTTL